MSWQISQQAAQPACNVVQAAQAFVGVGSAAALWPFIAQMNSQPCNTDTRGEGGGPEFYPARRDDEGSMAQHADLDQASHGRRGSDRAGALALQSCRIGSRGTRPCRKPRRPTMTIAPRMGTRAGSLSWVSAPTWDACSRPTKPRPRAQRGRAGSVRAMPRGLIFGARG